MTHPIIHKHYAQLEREKRIIKHPASIKVVCNQCGKLNYPSNIVEIEHMGFKIEICSKCHGITDDNS